ncbi:hypothetical protein EVAR_86268_1 [Eumeta japonica]|uniref:Uncharacterized protein n=1 Tax=Eumeta variegata TaxID=151549 RepID=A0A4C1UBT3_EUMVA|nr:hypothetical protein EVAR_86268_1 [Eumeta japonica]
MSFWSLLRRRRTSSMVKEASVGGEHPKKQSLYVFQCVFVLTHSVPQPSYNATECLFNAKTCRRSVPRDICPQTNGDAIIPAHNGARSHSDVNGLRASTSTTPAMCDGFRKPKEMTIERQQRALL